MTRRFRFFAVKEDLLNIFTVFESKAEVRYYQCGNFANTAEPFAIQSMLEYEKLGRCYTSSHVGNQFLVMYRSDKIQDRQGKILAGPFRRCVDQMSTPHSIVLNLKGIYGDSAIIVSEAGTIHYENAKAKALFDAFKAACHSRIVMEKTVNGYLVGKNAYLRKDIMRFVTIDIKSPIEYDLNL